MRRLVRGVGISCIVKNRKLPLFEFVHSSNLVNFLLLLEYMEKEGIM